MSKKLQIFILSASIGIVAFVVIGGMVVHASSGASTDGAYSHIQVYSEVLGHVRLDYVEEPNMPLLRPTLFFVITLGLIGTFQSLGNVPADQKQALLSAGISEAMNNTAFGLSIAETCIVFHLFLSAYAKRMIEVVELNALKLENLLARRNAGETSAMDFERQA